MITKRPVVCWLDYHYEVGLTTNYWSFGDHILPKSWYVYNVTQLYVWNDSESEDKYD